jgi:cytochrome oxidase Cu insertion factor (SCO1/SenC/PrrC family)
MAASYHDRLQPPALRSAVSRRLAGTLLGMTSSIQVGDPAPPFQLQDQDGQSVSLKDFAGRWLVLFFYPKDDTPG